MIGTRNCIPHGLLTEAIAKHSAASLEERLTQEAVPIARLRTLSEALKDAASGDLFTLPQRRTRYAQGTLVDFGGGY